MKIVILGASGMLGRLVLDYFCQNTEHDILATVRTLEQTRELQSRYLTATIKIFDALEPAKSKTKSLDYLLKDTDFVINCIGIIKPYIKDNDLDSCQKAILINSYFPYLLAETCEKYKVKCLQIATDCIFKGDTGNYNEDKTSDATDIYGKSKALGEVKSLFTALLRGSIIGPEVGEGVSLLNWTLRQPGEARGYLNHLWNGITTLHFAKICQGIIEAEFEDGFLPHIQHIVPKDIVSKYELLGLIAKSYNKNLVVNETLAPEAIDRTLATRSPQINERLWRLAGYSTPPTIAEMVEELAQYKFKGSK